MACIFLSASKYLTRSIILVSFCDLLEVPLKKIMHDFVGVGVMRRPGDVIMGIADALVPKRYQIIRNYNADCIAP